VTEVGPDPKSSTAEDRASYAEYFAADNFDVFDGATSQLFATQSTANSRPGSSGGAAAPRQPAVFVTETAGSASASTIGRQLEIAQEAIDDANNAAWAATMEAAQGRKEAAEAIGRAAAETRARVAAEAARVAAEADKEAALAKLAEMTKRLADLGLH
jgi:hypothetical protein